MLRSLRRWRRRPTDFVSFPPMISRMGGCLRSVVGESAVGGGGQGRREGSTSTNGQGNGPALRPGLLRIRFQSGRKSQPLPKYVRAFNTSSRNREIPWKGGTGTELGRGIGLASLILFHPQRTPPPSVETPSLFPSFNSPRMGALRNFLFCP